MEKIIIDTNVLLEIAKGLDIIEELKKVCDFSFRLYITEGIIKELDKISQRSNGKEGDAARIAVKYITGRFTVLKDRSDYVDDELVRLSDEGYMIATIDKELQKRVKRKIILRQGKRFMVI